MNQFDDDDDEYIADYIDLVLYAIVSNIERQKSFRHNPTDALLQEILNHSASITRAENCLNIHIRRIIRNFKTFINYDECMLGLDNGANANTTNAAETKQVHPVTNNDDSSSTHFAPAAREIEIEIANEATKTDISNGHNGTTSAETAIEADITSGNNAEYEVIENKLTLVKITKEVDITNGNAVRNEVDITSGNAVRNEVDITNENAVRNEVDITNGNAVRNEVDITNENAVRNEVDITNENAVRNEVNITNENAVGNEVDNTNGNAVRNEVDITSGNAVRNEVDITSGNAVRNEFGNAVRNEFGNAIRNDVGFEPSIALVGIAKEVDTTNEHAIKIAFGNAVETENEVGLPIASVEITNDVDITNGTKVKHKEVDIATGDTIENEIEVESSIASFEIANDFDITDGSAVGHDIEVKIVPASVEITRDIKAEIEYTKHRISIEIAEAIARTDCMIDAAVTNAIGNISQAHDDVSTNWNASTSIASTSISLNNHLTEGIAQAQHNMATEIERLLSNLDHGISRLKTGIENMHQQLGISNDVPIDLEIARKNPSSILGTTESPIDPEIAYENPTNILKTNNSSLLLMVQDLAQLEHDERLFLEMEGEKLKEITTNSDASLHLELEGQCPHDSVLHQLQDDVLYHEDALIEETIAQFDNLRSSDDDSYFGNDSPVNEFNEARAWWDEPLASNEEDEHEPVHDPGTWNATQRLNKALNDTKADNAADDSEVDDMDNDSDDINENTDTEDGNEDIVGLIQANMQLLNFLTKQRGTIARLRARVSRLNTVIQGLTARLGDPNPMTTNRTSDPDHLLRHAPRLLLCATCIMSLRLTQTPQYRVAGTTLPFYGTRKTIRLSCLNQTVNPRLT